ncbi:hypothetical protein BGX27_007687 [Mortierella sp. AM989]|nr:hypothetical protein BGX27_007687 [Mortierella sp. AM989]
MSHQRASSTSSISSAFDTHRNSSNQYPNGGMATAAASGSPPRSSAPLSISIPRQRSFSSSFNLASSPRTFTGSSIIANPSNGFLNSPGVGTTTPFSAAFGGPLSSPTSTSFSSSVTNTTTVASSAPTSQTAPILHRRFSSSFNQLNQIAGSSPTNAQTIDRGRRASLFGGTSPPMTPLTPTTQSSTEGGNAKPGLFRKFSTSGRSAGHPFDRNDVGPANLGPQPNGQHQIATANVAATNSGNSHLSAVDKLKPSQDKHSRSSSPMRSMILNGQMLD